jgi:hypothetical protein
MTTGEHITKAAIVKAMQSLQRLRFMQAVEDGFRQVDAGQSVSQDEVERRLAGLRS